MSNKMVTVKYVDMDTVDSMHLVAAAYGLEIKAAAPIDSENSSPNEIWLTVYGPSDCIDRFVEDNEEDNLEPFDQTVNMSDNEYQDWLSNQLARFCVLYIPKYT